MLNMATNASKAKICSVSSSYTGANLNSTDVRTVPTKQIMDSDTYYEMTWTSQVTNNDLENSTDANMIKLDNSYL